MYFVHSPANNLVYVGDRANNRVVAFDALSFTQQGQISVGTGVFHMWGNAPQNQLWVVNDGAGNPALRNLSVVDMVTMTPITTIPIPADLIAAGGVPHDIVIDTVNRQAFVTINNTTTGVGTVVRFSTDTFLETGRVTSGDSLHVFLNESNNLLYVLSEAGDRIDVFNRSTLALVDTIPFFNAHGVDSNADGSRVYVSSFPAAPPPPGVHQLATIDSALIGTPTDPIIDVIDTAVAGLGPHNVAVTVDGSRIYISHTGSNIVSFYDIGPNGIPTLAGEFPTVAGANVFGIAAIPGVPEPSTWLLMVTGGLPLAGALWRRARRK